MLAMHHVPTNSTTVQNGMGEVVGEDAQKPRENRNDFRYMMGWSGGEGGIRTHGTLARSTVFETAPIDHSGTSPHLRVVAALLEG